MGLWTRAWLLAAAAACAFAQTPLAVDALTYTPPRAKTLRIAVTPPGAAAGLDLPSAVALPPLDPSALQTVNSRGQRPIGATRTVDGIPGVWTALPGSRSIWRAAIRSAGAVALRVHFRRTGAGRLWVYASGGEVEGPLSPGIDVWSGTVSSDTALIEYEGASGDEPAVDSIAHFAGDAASSVLPAAGSPAAGPSSCQLDYKCYEKWATPGQAVAMLIFQSSQDLNFYTCSGSLLNTRNNSHTPYFLTANHCISADAEARSAQVYWFYETPQCNGTPPARTAVPRTDGARLLATAGQAAGDFSLLLLNALPDRPVVFAGWNPQGIAIGDAVTGIHHPAGSYKRIDFGARTFDQNVIIGGTIIPGDKFYQVRETDGRTEGGASGSPLFDAASRVVGVLSYGAVPPPGQTICDVSDYSSGYGRFPVVYAGIRGFLEEQPGPAVTATPQALAFRGSPGAIANPASQPLRLETTSAAALSYTLEASQGWVHFSQNSGSLSAATPASIDVSLDPTAFRNTGRYTAAITVRSDSLILANVAVTVDIGLSQSAVAAAITPDPIYQQAPDAEGFSWFYTVQLDEKAGVDARITRILIDGVDYTNRIQEWFGADRIAAFSSVRVSLRARDLAVPLQRVFEFSGSDANGLAWIARATGRFQGRRASALVLMNATPNPVPQNPDSSGCPWKHDITLTELGGIGVNLTGWRAGGTDLSGEIPSWFGSSRLEPNGLLKTTLCWSNLAVPTTLPFEIAGRDDAGGSISASAQARFVGPAATPSPKAAPEQVSFAAVSGRNETLRAAVVVDPGAARANWTARVAYAGGASGWLAFSPQSGTGPASLTLIPTPGVLAQGRYQATLLVTVPGATPGELQIPVQLAIGAQAAGMPQFFANAVVNAASFQPRLTAGMLFTIFGQNLAGSAAQARQLPLGVSMNGVTVRANGAFCPLLAVTPTQINAQLPWEIQPGRLAITVNVEGRELSQTVEASPVAPGLFTTDGQRLTPHAAGRRGEVRVAYITGAGPVAPDVPTGAGPLATRVEDLPLPILPLQVTIAGVPAKVLFAGIPPGVVGAVQINYQIPDSLPFGPQQVVVTVGGVRTNSGVLQIVPESGLF